MKQFINQLLCFIRRKKARKSGHHLLFPLVTLALMCQFSLSGCSSTTQSLPPSVIRIDDPSKLIDQISEFRAVCVGEAHTAPHHHANQLQVIQGLHEKGVDVAIGLEMFPYTSQALLDGWVEGSITREEFAEGYYQNWQIPLEMYEQIFLYARKESIPLLGLNVPKSVAARVARGGVHSLSSRERADLPEDIFCKPDLPQMQLLLEVLASRGNGARLFGRFCEAHMLRDKTMGLTGGNYLKQNPGKTLVVLAGIGHCEKQGTPYQLEEISGERSVVILPAASEEVLRQPMTLKNTDYLLEE